jgi:hypothetical protein
MVFLSKDKLIKIEQAESLTDVVFPPADWSVVNASMFAGETATIYKRLYDTPNSNHISLCLFRQKRKNRIKALASVGEVQDWSYLDTINIVYDKPSSSPNNGLLPVSESGVLFFKGSQPDVSKTGWFREVYDNATNHWDLGVQEQELQKFAYFQKFSWEMNLLLKGLCGNLEHRRFVYGVSVTTDDIKNIHAFCKLFQVQACVYAPTVKECEKLIAEVMYGS